MAHKLTKLQRIGISSLLYNLRVHGVENIDSGVITFETNKLSQWINMYVNAYHERHVYAFTLEYSEDIDDSIVYEFDYDIVAKMYHIYEREERTVES